MKKLPLSIAPVKTMAESQCVAAILATHEIKRLQGEP